MARQKKEESKEPMKTKDDMLGFLFGQKGEEIGEETEELVREEVNKAIKETVETKIAAAVEQETNKLISGKIAEILPVLLDSKLEHFKTFPREVEIVRRDKEGKEESRENIGVQHFRFEKLRQFVEARVHTALIGPMGSGKTRATAAAAKACGLEFYKMSVGPQTSQSNLMGYMDMKGEYVRSPLRDAAEYGGVILLDEFDASNPGVGTIINGIVDGNDTAGFSDGKIKVHPDFVCVLNMNTYGRGADRVYVGRNQLDGATPDRFAMFPWPYDEDLERAICLTNPEWVTWVQHVRHALDALKIRHPVSPRASIMGDRLLNVGVDREELEECLVWKGLAETEKAKVLRWIDDNVDEEEG
jgi:AAA domain (dynein-related subfamily)